MSHKGEIETIARYRLELVRDPSTPYEAPINCTRPHLVSRFLEQLLAGFDREVLGALFLDGRNRCVGHTIAYVGTLQRAMGEPRGILVPALLANAAGVILFHNHPSGDPGPSAEDMLFTRRMEEAADLLGVNFVDHFILGEGASVSMRDTCGW